MPATDWDKFMQQVLPATDWDKYMQQVHRRLAQRKVPPPASRQLPLPLPAVPGILSRRCLYNLNIGKPNPMAGSGKYSVCITPSQHKRLFGEIAHPPRVVGCGSFACAYDAIEPDKVVKITSDQSDVAGLQAAQITTQRALPRALRLYATYQIPTARWLAPGGKPRDQAPVYAMVVERLRPLTPTQRRLWSHRLGIINRDLELGLTSINGDLNYSVTTLKDMIGKACPRPPRMTRGVIWVGPRDVKASKCRAFVLDMARAYRDFTRADINWSDRHSGNIGIDSHGRWKVLDLGFSNRNLYSEPPTLAGRSRRAR